MVPGESLKQNYTIKSPGLLMRIELKTSEEHTAEIDIRCVAIKIGSAVITRDLGKLDKALISSYARVISDLCEQGVRIVIVSSGAVSAGIGEMERTQLPRSIPEKQALASIGQGSLMKVYTEAFEKYGIYPLDWLE